MAREFIDGFESDSLTLWVSTGGSLDTASTYGMDGSYCAILQSTINYKVVTARDAYYMSFLMRSATSGCNVAVNIGNGTTVLGRVHFTTTAGIKAYRDDGVTLLDTGDTILNINTTYLIEAYYLPKTDGTGSFIVKVNGVEEINYTGQTSNSALQIDRVTIVVPANSCYLDNFILDSSDWIGRTKIQAIVPTGAGTTTQYDPSTGSNYACVDELPYSDTDYISTNTPDEIDTYATGNMTGDVGSVKCVQLQARTKYEGSSAVTKLDLAVRSGGTNYFSADKTLTTSYTTESNLWETNPNTSTAWTETTVNAMEIGVKAKA